MGVRFPLPLPNLKTTIQIMRKSKLITVKFDDGEQILPSSLKVKCNATGTSKGFYTPYLIKLIKKKYNNDYGYFLANYVSKGHTLKKTVDEDEEPSLSLYKTTLRQEYSFLSSRKQTTHSRVRMTQIEDVFQKRFPEESPNDE